MKIETMRKRMVSFSPIGLTDIVLLLLIFFLLTSSFVIQPGIKVKLPKAASGQVDDSNQIFVTIVSENQVYVNQKQLAVSELGSLLKRLLQEDPQKVVVIRADKNLALQVLIRVVDIAKMAGAEKFIIATEPQV